MQAFRLQLTIKKKANIMKNQMNTSDIVNALLGDENADWTYNGALALAEWLEAYEEDTGIEMEFDHVALRCDFSEAKSLQDWVDGYFGVSWLSEIDCDEESDKEDIDAAIREYIEDRGTLIEFDGGIIVSSF